MYQFADLSASARSGQLAARLESLEDIRNGRIGSDQSASMCNSNREWSQVRARQMEWTGLKLLLERFVRGMKPSAS
jgi:hypothetical protein